MDLSPIQQAFSLLAQRQRRGTRSVLIKEGVALDLEEYAQSTDLTAESALLLFDSNTFDAIGEAAIQRLHQSSWTITEYCCRGSSKHKPPSCTDHYITTVKKDLHDHVFDLVITIGAGTITDIGKLIAADRSIPVISVATAPSMNGYTSAISAILKNGVKQTVPSVAPILCVADPEVLANAPTEMIGSGAGDAYSRFMARSDWLLSQRLHKTIADTKLAEVLRDAATLLRTVPSRIQSESTRTDAICDLSVVLYTTGLAQQAALPGTQASGGEHLVSHYLDMIGGHPDFSHSADLHGRQVAVGTVYAARLYEQLRGSELLSPDVNTLVEQHPSPETFKARIREHFRGLSPAILKTLEGAIYDTATYRQRLQNYQKNAGKTVDDIMRSWVSSEDIRDELSTCGAPTTFADIGVSPSLARDTVSQCRHVRNRFTVLHLAAELTVSNELPQTIAASM